MSTLPDHRGSGFTDPWRVAEANRWTSPQLDAPPLPSAPTDPWKRAAQELKLKFLGEAQALVHGDLHSGSIMVTEKDTHAIDPEFAFYGPMGFDVGALIGNLYLAYFSQSGHEAKLGGRDNYRDWILQTIETDLDAVRPAVPSAVEQSSCRRRLHAGAVRRRSLSKVAVRFRHRMPICVDCSSIRGLRRLQDDAPHPGPCPCRGHGKHRRSRSAGPPVRRGRSALHASSRSKAQARRSDPSTRRACRAARGREGVGMKVDDKPYRTIWLGTDGATVQVIDQTAAAASFYHPRSPSPMEDAERAIRTMIVRGAPLIGATAAYGMALAMADRPHPTPMLAPRLQCPCWRRDPTAVNLRWALDDLRRASSPAAAGRPYAKPPIVRAAEICDKDAESAAAIGAGLARDQAPSSRAVERLNALTHCNAGWLATVDWGTALAPIYQAHNAALPIHVWVDKTRPRNQGAA